MYLETIDAQDDFALQSCDNSKFSNRVGEILKAMNTIAIVSARGGSKRIPEKNIRAFCGQPIVGNSIEAAFDSGVFDEVIVSTDDEQNANI